jgi:AcrR family transcriptional regulator
MKAKSTHLAESRKKVVARKRARPAPKAGVQRLPRAERQARVLAKAAEYFSEYGLTVQTRAIADACGISQRLLYRLFPSKASLLEEVYQREIAGGFKAVWFVQLKDRSRSLEERLNAFYCDYYDSVLTRRWLRLFLYASLAEYRMAPNYTDAVVTHSLEIIMEEVAHATGLPLPADAHRTAEIGWQLHGAVSHLAIRRHIYFNENPTPPHEVIAMHVQAFLKSVPALLQAAVPA